MANFINILDALRRYDIGANKLSRIEKSQGDSMWRHSEDCMLAQIKLAELCEGGEVSIMEESSPDRNDSAESAIRLRTPHAVVELEGETNSDGLYALCGLKSLRQVVEVGDVFSYAMNAKITSEHRDHTRYIVELPRQKDRTPIRLASIDKSTLLLLAFLLNTNTDDFCGIATREQYLSSCYPELREEVHRIENLSCSSDVLQLFSGLDNQPALFHYDNFEKISIVAAESDGDVHYFPEKSTLQKKAVIAKMNSYNGELGPKIQLRCRFTILHGYWRTIVDGFCVKLDIRHVLFWAGGPEVTNLYESFELQNRLTPEHHHLLRLYDDVLAMRHKLPRSHVIIDENMMIRFQQVLACMDGRNAPVDK